MKNYFISRKIIWQHIKLAKRYLIFFFVFWIIVLIPVYLFPIWTIDLDYPFGICLGAYRYHAGRLGGTHAELYDILRYFVFSTPSLIYFSIVFIFLINKFIIGEIKSNRISYWLTTENSRNKVLFSKYLFMLLVVLMLYLPIFIFSTIMALLAYDVKIYFWYVFWSEFNFLAAIILFLSLFFLMGVVLANRKNLFDAIYSLFVIYFVITYVLELLVHVSTLFHDIFWVFKYISFSGLSQFVLNFDKPIEDQLVYIKYVAYNSEPGEYYSYKEVITSAWIVILVVFTNLSLACGCVFLALKNFKNKHIYA
ncbi:hypothetical protein [Spiroplasma endosymbiont of Aspidapion aeneum]|uniref:hypothetical protein n=1 Tax=Spiroplasma endosymbiont of Aspidapion aeneum TaxID=3066276 RepID=UPI00313EC4DB